MMEGHIVEIIFKHELDTPAMKGILKHKDESSIIISDYSGAQGDRLIPMSNILFITSLGEWRR